MHYFQFHIGDYASHTRHLSHMEDLAYRRLLDFYYLHENPIKHHDIARQIGMRDQEQDVLTVLNEFFLSTPNGFVSPRADKEIQHFHSKVEQASKAGKASAERRLNGRSTDVQPTNNHKPITINHKPKNTATVVASPDGVSSDVWESFVKQRKAKRAQITDMVINNIKREAESAGWSLEDALKEIVVRNWQSFKADWVAKPANKADQVFTTVPSRFERDPALIAVEQKLKEAVPMPPEIRAAMERLRK